MVIWKQDLKNLKSNFSFCHENLYSLIAHNILTVPLLEAYKTIHIYDFICISKIYFDSLVEVRMIISKSIVSNYFTQDHLSHAKKGGACI